MEQGVRAQARVHVVQQRQVGGRIQAFALVQQPFPDQHLLDVFMAELRQLHLALLLVDGKVAVLALRVRLEQGHQLVDVLVQLRTVLCGAGDDQRRARFIDENRVDLVDNREAEFPLQLVLQREGHVVAQVVETELVVGAVHDVGAVGGTLLFLCLPGTHNAHAQTQEFVERAHPVRVATGEVVVDRHQVHGPAAEGIEIGRQGRHQGLALTGTHLRDGPRAPRRTPPAAGCRDSPRR